jgi:hypothetical protein
MNSTQGHPRIMRLLKLAAAAVVLASAFADAAQANLGLTGPQGAPLTPVSSAVTGVSATVTGTLDAATASADNTLGDAQATAAGVPATLDSTVDGTVGQVQSTLDATVGDTLGSVQTTLDATVSRTSLLPLRQPRVRPSLRREPYLRPQVS